MTSSSLQAEGQLSIWTDVDPAHESEFNLWYNREHMQERMAIQGFRRARRFRALGLCPLPYLALYDTDSVQVFRSQAYQQALAQQTDWSLRNLAHMRDTQRRVGEVIVDLGEGEGGTLAMFVMANTALLACDAMPSMQTVAERPKVVRVSLLRTDVSLSAPLSAAAPAAQPDLVVMVEATDAEAAFDAAGMLARQIPADQASVFYTFQAMIRMGRSE